MRQNAEEIVKELLLDGRVDIDQSDKDGVTPLILGVYLQQENVVRVLLRKGADVNATTSSGVTALHAAAEKKSQKLVELLIKNGASVDMQDHAGFTGLGLALQTNSLEIVKLLLSKGAASSLTDQFGRTAYELAISDQARELLKSSVDYKRTIELMDIDPKQLITSDSHPYQAEYLPRGILRLNSLGIGGCPGENVSLHRRDLLADVRKLKEQGTEVLVTLLQLKEIQEMGCSTLFCYLRKAGIESLWFPLSDRWIPESMSGFVGAVKGIEQHVLNGKHVVVHCNSTKRRSRMAVVAVLMALGLTGSEARRLTRTSRNAGIENPAQVLFLKLFKKSWQEDVVLPRAPRPITTNLSNSAIS
eukprot:TRINITY_DN3996_c0_g1_i1.p1 TRINITY_DN3996_c0_g1~~TRINITY_DN3996_c0_g1_i1.p1  ORF type:complete len:360 (-),score=71.78 TRINITY_DN3996_c0_g1_i1:106-1185(-)